MIIGPGITIEQGISLVYSGPDAAPRQTGALSTNPYVAYTTTGIATASTPSIWGGGSGNFTTSTRIASATNTTFANVGTGDFTFEFWNYVPAATSNSTSAEFFQVDTAGGVGLRFGPQNAGGSYNWISIYARAQADLDRAPITWSRDQWNFVVVQRSSTVINFWVNGVLLTRQNGPSGTAATRNFTNAGASSVTFGTSFNGGAPSGCYFNDFCISNGFARYAANSPFTAIPTAPLQVDQYTSQLMSFRGANGGTVFQNSFY